MKMKLLPIVLVTIAVMIYYFRPSDTEENRSAEQAVSEAMAKSLAEAQIDDLSRAFEVPPFEDNIDGDNGFLPTSLESKEKFNTLNKEIEAMGKCLGIAINGLKPDQTFNAELLHILITPFFGEAIATQTDWQSVDLRTSIGEVRRLFVEFIQTEGSFQKRLTYYSYKDGSPQEISLSPNQKNNPSDILLASLESDGDVMARSRAQKVFYKNGSKLQVVEKSGMLFAFSLPRNGAVFSCSNLDKASLSCRCDQGSN